MHAVTLVPHDFSLCASCHTRLWCRHIKVCSFGVTESVSTQHTHTQPSL